MTDLAQLAPLGHLARDREKSVLKTMPASDQPGIRFFHLQSLTNLTEEDLDVAIKDLVQNILVTSFKTDSNDRFEVYNRTPLGDEFAKAQLRTHEITYIGDYNEYTRCKTVWVDTGFKRIPLGVNPSLKHVNHSPNGFEWGYGGSGPAQLAFALLLDTTNPMTAQHYYQIFKVEIISNMPDQWELNQYQILHWLREKELANDSTTTKAEADD